MEMHGVLTMKYLLLAALLLVPLPALAQQDENDITITVKAAQGGKTSQTWTMTSEDMAAFQEWVLSQYGGSPGPGRPAYTPDEAMTAWADATLKGTSDNITRYHKLKAAQDAANGVPPIEPQFAPPAKEKKK